MAQYRVQVNELKDELEKAIGEQNFTKAQEVQKKIAEIDGKISALSERPSGADAEVVREERDDPMTLLKCLSIVCELLKNAPVCLR